MDNPLTPHEVHTLREIIREQRQAAARGGRELMNPWLAVERLLDERETLKALIETVTLERDNYVDALRLCKEKLQEIEDAECCFVTAMSLNSITCSRVCQVLASDFLEEIPF